MLKVSTSGSFDGLEKFVKRIQNGSHFEILNKYGEMGVEALSAATPIESGETARSWRYTIKRTFRTYTIYWSNDHVEQGTNIAIILQYGHGTGTGGWVEGRDYINPALRKLFDQMADDLWREVSSNGER